jgi:hypothetical protein
VALGDGKWDGDDEAHIVWTESGIIDSSGNISREVRNAKHHLKIVHIPYMALHLKNILH